MIKVVELFAGIGSQRKALERLGVEHEVVLAVEWDKYAWLSYEAIHGETPHHGDITTLERLPPCDLVTYSFPCQDLSVAGKQAGIKKGTRSGLLYEVERLLDGMDEKPRYLLLENVKNLVSKRHKPDFDKWLSRLEEMGYNNYWKVLNAKNYGIPQNRERVFVVSIREDVNAERTPYVMGFLDNDAYKFPEPVELKLKLKDLLEDEVDEKYYLSENEIIYMNRKTKDGRTHWDFKHHSDEAAEFSRCLTSNMAKGVPYNVLKTSYKLEILVKEATKKGFAFAYEGDSINLEQPNSKTRRGRVGRGVAQTLTTSPQQAVVNYRIRKLTPKECWRLMGFDDEDFEKAEAVCSNSQLYKQAGNSIVVDVLEYIFNAMLINEMLLFKNEENHSKIKGE